MASTRRVAGSLLTAAAVACAGGLLDRRDRRRNQPSAHPDQAIPFGTLHSTPRTVLTDDGVALHIEIDEVDAAQAVDVAEPSAGKPLTVIFAHGFGLNADCWHFQRAAFRGLVRTVFYDQRSHGRSAPGEVTGDPIGRLGRDLKCVIDAVAPDGPVVVVAHSMGAMGALAFAADHPDLIGTKVVAMGLLSAAGSPIDLGKAVVPLMPSRISGPATSAAVRLLANAPGAVDRVRRIGRPVIADLTERFTFAGRVSPEYGAFVNSMFEQTPFSVMADFMPGLTSFDVLDRIGVLGTIETTLMSGLADKVIGLDLCRQLHSTIAGSRFIECPGAGHMVMVERHGQVNAGLDQLLSAARVATQ